MNKKTSKLEKDLDKFIERRRREADVTDKLLDRINELSKDEFAEIEELAETFFAITVGETLGMWALEKDAVEWLMAIFERKEQHLGAYLMAKGVHQQLDEKLAEIVREMKGERLGKDEFPEIIE